MSANTYLLRRLREMPSVASKTAVFVDRDGTRVRVNTGDTTITVPFVGLYLPPRGMAVQMELRNNQWVVTGPANPLPGEGIVTAATTPRATVSAWGRTYSLRHETSYTPTLSDRVAIAWYADGDGVITGKLSAASNNTPPAEAGPATPQRFHPEPFTAIDSGTWRAGSGWWTRTVRANVDDGAWFYGSKIKDTIPDSATIVAARIFIPVQDIVINYRGLLRRHIHPTKPGGAPTFTGATKDVQPVTGWVDVPLDWIDALKAGDGGLGFDGGGQWVCKGTDTDALSGALDIEYDA